MQLRFPASSAPSDPALGQPDAMPETTMSAARQAAEAAFQLGKPSASEDAPTVTVRRSRGSATGRANAEAEPLVQTGRPASGASKRPRVFLLPSGALGPESTAIPHDPTAAAQSLPLRRGTRAASVQRPGPVVHLFKAAADGLAPASAPLATPAEVPTFAQLRALAHMLTGVQSILDEAGRASAFRVLASDRPSSRHAETS